MCVSGLEYFFLFSLPVFRHQSLGNDSCYKFIKIEWKFTIFLLIIYDLFFSYIFPTFLTSHLLDFQYRRPSKTTKKNHHLGDQIIEFETNFFLFHSGNLHTWIWTFWTPKKNCTHWMRMEEEAKEEKKKVWSWVPECTSKGSMNMQRQHTKQQQCDEGRRGENERKNNIKMSRQTKQTRKKIAGCFIFLIYFGSSVMYIYIYLYIWAVGRLIPVQHFN